MKRLSFILLTIFASTFVYAQEQNRYNISLYGVYGYNETFGHVGGFDLVGYLPINKYFEMDAALEFQSPQTCAVSAFARPKFPLPVGELFLDGAVNFRYWGTYSMGTLATSGSFGYRMDYVSVQIGMNSLVLLDMLREKGSGSENVSEPFNLTYRLAFNVRPSTSVWNINFGVSNYNLYEFERDWQCIFFLGGHYDFTKDFTALLEAELKPTGIFHMNARFWGLNIRAGVKYRF